jgi:hypothetical protein
LTGSRSGSPPPRRPWPDPGQEGPSAPSLTGPRSGSHLRDALRRIKAEQPPPRAVRHREQVIPLRSEVRPWGRGWGAVYSRLRRSSGRRTGEWGRTRVSSGFYSSTTWILAIYPRSMAEIVQTFRVILIGPIFGF